MCILTQHKIGYLHKIIEHKIIMHGLSLKQSSPIIPPILIMILQINHSGKEVGKMSLLLRVY